jgi:hypothetical protein
MRLSPAGHQRRVRPQARAHPNRPTAKCPTHASTEIERDHRVSCNCGEVVGTRLSGWRVEQDRRGNSSVPELGPQHAPSPRSGSRECGWKPGGSTRTPCPSGRPLRLDQKRLLMETTSSRATTAAGTAGRAGTSTARSRGGCSRQHRDEGQVELVPIPVAASVIGDDRAARRSRTWWALRGSR